MHVISGPSRPTVRRLRTSARPRPRRVRPPSSDCRPLLLERRRIPRLGIRPRRDAGRLPGRGRRRVDGAELTPPGAPMPGQVTIREELAERDCAGAGAPADRRAAEGPGRRDPGPPGGSPRRRAGAVQGQAHDAELMPADVLHLGEALRQGLRPRPTHVAGRAGVRAAEAGGAPLRSDGPGRSPPIEDPRGSGSAVLRWHQASDADAGAAPALPAARGAGRGGATGRAGLVPDHPVGCHSARSPWDQSHAAGREALRPSPQPAAH